MTLPSTQLITNLFVHGRLKIPEAYSDPVGYVR